MTITIGAIAIPIVLTIIIFAIMCRPMSGSGGGFFGDAVESFFRLLWWIPIMLIWCAYFGYGWWNATHSENQTPKVEIKKDVE